MLGKPTKNNYTLYWDRRNTLGLKYFDNDVLYESLKLFSPTAQKISNSNKKEIFCSKKIFSIEDICTSLLELKRLPILVILKNNNELEYLQKIHEAFANKILQNEISLFLYEMISIYLYTKMNQTKNHEKNSTICRPSGG